MIVDAIINKPPTNEEFVSNWFKKVVDAVGMKLLAEPLVKYCKAENNEGIAAVCLISTSHLSLHVWDKENPPYLKFDLYSCSDFAPIMVLKFIDEFEPTNLTFKIIDRNML